MSCCEELKTLTIFKNYPTRFAGRPLTVLNIQSEQLDLTGYKAYFTLCGVTKEFDDITSPVEVNFTAEETGTFPIGLNYADIIVEDPSGHGHPFSTSIPCLVKDFFEGDIELDNFDITITTDIQENTITINFDAEGTGGTFLHDELAHRDFDDQHPISAITGLEDRLGATETAIGQEIQDRQDGDTTLQQNIATETLNRQQADTALGNRIDTEAQAREDEDEALDQRVDEVVGDLDDHIQDKDNPHEVTKAQVGLGNVDNTSDMSKPVSTAQGNAIQAVQDNLDDETDARVLAIQGLENSKQDNIDDLSTIRSNASDGKSASDTIATYGNIVTHNTSEFATAGQGTKADTALQPSDLSATSPVAYNSSTKTISVASGYQIPTTTQVGKIGTNETAIATIQSLIPEQATSGNQLADKSFVNSTVGTNTANYISNNGQPFTSLAQLQAYTGTVTNNDYAFITGTDEEGNTFYDRYKATVTGTTISWAKEYRLNNSSFTASQWASIQSGITAGDVALIGTALQPQDNVSELTNDAGYITGISSSDVTGALGYTPYNATNPSGYISSITGAMVTTALGYTPYNSTNPNNYISRSGISATSPIAYNNSTGVVSVASGYQIPTTTQITTFTNKQDAITDLATIRTNAQAGKNASDTIATYGNIVTHNASEFATSAQGAKADTAVQNLGDLGITATATELNYVDGVTSSIQTQLNGKQPNLPSGTTGHYLQKTVSGVQWSAVDALPSQTGQNGKFLKTNGTSASWDTITVTFSSLAGQPTDNTNLASALNAKVDKSSLSQVDCVIESKYPTSSDPTWYRLYASGWVEQGGITSDIGKSGTITFEKEMADTNYTLMVSSGSSSDSTSAYQFSLVTQGKTTTGFDVRRYSNSTTRVEWEVKGMSA